MFPDFERLPATDFGFITDMNQRLKPAVHLLLALSCLTSTVSGQPSGRKSFGDLPKVGERLPAITIVDADGNDFHLRSLKDNYTVLVFGCLT